MSTPSDRLRAAGPPPAPLAAALWDFDGTLADTEPIWIEAEFALIGQLGGEWTEEHAHQLVGNSLLDSGAYILNHIGRHDLTPAWLVDQLLHYVIERVTSGPMPWRPGARALLEAFNAAGVPCALVSASYRRLLDAALTRQPQGAFQVSIAGGLPRPGRRRPALRGDRGLRERRPVRERRRRAGHRRAQPGGHPPRAPPRPRGLPG